MLFITFQKEINPKTREAVAWGSRHSHILLMGVQNGGICMWSNPVISPNNQNHSLQGIHLKMGSHHVMKEIWMDICSYLLVAALFVIPKAT